MIGLGHSRSVLELVAKEHNLKETSPDPDVFPNSGNYPITFMTPDLFTTFYIPQPEPFSDNVLAPFPSTVLPNPVLVQKIKDVISQNQRFYNTPKPDLAALRAAKVAKKQALVDYVNRLEEDKRIWKELKARAENGEDITLPDMPLSGRKRRRKEKLEKQMNELWGDEEEPNQEYPSHFFETQLLLPKKPDFFKDRSIVNDQVRPNSYSS